MNMNNTKLASLAPEMLSLLKEIYEGYQNAPEYDGLEECYEDQIRDIIIRATEQGE